VLVKRHPAARAPERWNERGRESNGFQRSRKSILSLSKEPALSLSKGFVTGPQGCGR